MLTQNITKLKEVILKLIKITPKSKLKKTVNLEELNLEEDDPLLEAADQLSDPETPDISARFKIQQNIKKDAKKQHKERQLQKLKDYQDKLMEEEKDDLSENLPPLLSTAKERNNQKEEEITYKDDEVQPESVELEETQSNEQKQGLQSQVKRVRMNKLPQKIEESNK